jgi:hypothetical protein
LSPGFLPNCLWIVSALSSNFSRHFLRCTLNFLSRFFFFLASSIVPTVVKSWVIFLFFGCCLWFFFSESSPPLVTAAEFVSRRF